MKDLFSLKDKVIIITGACGLLGKVYVNIIAQYGGTPILIDLDIETINEFVKLRAEKFIQKFEQQQTKCRGCGSVSSRADAINHAGELLCFVIYIQFCGNRIKVDAICQSCSCYHVHNFKVRGHTLVSVYSPI